MKRTLTVNLGGVAFTIDDDAYDMLKEYLKKIERHFPNQSDREILSDVETRIAELFTERLGRNRQVVDIDDVQYAVSTLGNPDQFDDDDSTDHADSSGASTSADERKSRRAHRKFYRDTDNCILGGVASGLASYLGWDTTLVRLLLIVVLVLGFGYIIPAYLIVWLIAPEAKTTSQKLEMKGVEPSIENILNYIESDRFRNSASRIGSRLGQVCIWLFRIAAIVVGITLAAVGVFVVAVIIYALVVVLFVGGQSFVLSYLPFLDCSIPMFTLLALSALLSLIIPIVAIISSTIRLLRGDKNMFNTEHKKWGWVWFAIWIVASLSFIIALALNVKNWTYLYSDAQISSYYDANAGTIEKTLVGAEFNSLNVSAGARVQLVYDSIAFVEIRGFRPDCADVDVEGNVLNISLRRNNNLPGINDPLFVVHYTSLNEIKGTSAAYVYNDDNDLLRTDKMTISTTSASKVEVNISSPSVAVLSTSASKVELVGICERLSATATSASKLDLTDLAVSRADVRTTSAASIELNTDTIEASATSGGKIRFDGTPVVLSAISNSGGSIKQD